VVPVVVELSEKVVSVMLEDLVMLDVSDVVVKVVEKV